MRRRGRQPVVCGTSTAAVNLPMPRRTRCLRLGGRLRVHHGGPRGTRLLASRFSFKNARVFAPEVWCRASEQPALLALDFLADLGLPGSVCTAIPSSLQRCHLLSELSLADHKTFQSGVTVHPEVVRPEPCARDVRFEEARGVTAPTSSNAVSRAMSGSPTIRPERC